MVGLISMSALAAACSSTPVEAACAKQAECGELPDGQTEEQCVEVASAQIEELRAKPACEVVADHLEGFVACVGELTCEEIKASDLSGSSCGSRLVAALTAAEASEGECVFGASSAPDPGE